MARPAETTYLARTEHVPHFFGAKRNPVFRWESQKGAVVLRFIVRWVLE